MQRSRFHDAELMHTPIWPVVFALCAGLGILVYVLLLAGE